MYYGYFWGPDRQSLSTKFWFLVFRAIVKTAVSLVHEAIAAPTLTKMAVSENLVIVAKK